MKTAKLSLAILIAMTAACAHPGAGMSPKQRETALLNDLRNPSPTALKAAE